MLHRQQANILELYNTLAKVGFLFFVLFFPLRKTPEQWTVMYAFVLVILWIEVWGKNFYGNISKREIFLLWLKTAILLLVFKVSMIIAGFSSLNDSLMHHLSTLSLWQISTDYIFSALRPSLIYTIGFILLIKLTSKKPQESTQAS